MAAAYKASDFLSAKLAKWACALKYEHLSPRPSTRQALLVRLLGCALGGSQQEDAHILLAHYTEMAGPPLRAPSASSGHPGPCTCFVSGFKTNPVDAAFLNAHMIRAMDYNDIYWKADPCHPSDIIAGPLALCEMLGLSGKDLILATVIAYEWSSASASSASPACASTAGTTPHSPPSPPPSPPHASSTSHPTRWSRPSASPPHAPSAPAPSPPASSPT
jgi:2-methylcitrate dehydratase